MNEPSRLGRLLGICCGAAGAGLLLSWVMLRVSGRAPLFPFYDSVVSLGSGKMFAVVAIYSALLLITSWALLMRRRFAPLLFTAAGWGALINTALLLWPRQRLRNMVEFALGAAKKRGMVADDAGVIDLIKTQLSPAMFNAVVALLITVLVVWLVLLVLGTRHVLRARAEYSN